MTQSHSSLSLSDLTFTWPDGESVFSRTNFVFPSGRVGLVGLNGSGKSTLLRLIAGELSPESGSVTASGEVGYLRQDITLDPSVRVDDILDIHELRNALHRIETGDGSESDFALVDNNWDIEESALSTLHRLGLAKVVPDTAALSRTVGTLSGGETVLLGLTATLLKNPQVLLLDEPTNNLDRDARSRVHAAVQQFPGTVLIVSHDRELLDTAEYTVELRRGDLRVFGGNYSHYQEVVTAEQENALATVRDAKADLAKQSRELIDARTKLDRRKRYGQKMFENKRVPLIIAQERKRQAQVSAGKLALNHIGKVDEAKSALSEAEELLRDDREIRLDLPATEVHPGQQVARLDEVTLRSGQVVSLQITGPERIAIMGRNGIGKTTLLDALAASTPFVASRALPNVSTCSTRISRWRTTSHWLRHTQRPRKFVGSWHGSFSGERIPTSWHRRSPAVNDCAPRWRRSFWPNPRLSCFFSTSRPTIWTYRVSPISRRHFPISAVPWWW
ncbi:hypothetical protein GCM10020255_054050 [Rhodococcus baikonurensis]